MNNTMNGKWTFLGHAYDIIHDKIIRFGFGFVISCGPINIGPISHIPLVMLERLPREVPPYIIMTKNDNKRSRISWVLVPDWVFLIN